MLNEVYEQNQLNNYTDWAKANLIVVITHVEKEKNRGSTIFHYKRDIPCGKMRKHYGTGISKKQGA